MYPTYSFKDVESFSLSSDDIQGIQSLYGKYSISWRSSKILKIFIYYVSIPSGRNTVGTRDVPDPKPPTNPDACDPKLILDAVTTFGGETMFFKDK